MCATGREWRMGGCSRVGEVADRMQASSCFFDWGLGFRRKTGGDRLEAACCRAGYGSWSCGVPSQGKDEFISQGRDVSLTLRLQPPCRVTQNGGRWGG